MAGWSSLKYALVASCAFSLTQIAEALPTDGSMSQWETSSQPGIFRRQNAIAAVGVNQGFGPAAGQVPVRKEIRTMISNTAEFHLFLLALQRMQATPQNVDSSYYQIAGIHGRPYRAWNGNTGRGNPNSGYCTHADALFLPWHRPYIALFEQILWEHARTIVNEFPADRRAPYAAALPTLRMPYWDWALDARMPAELGEMQTIQVNTPQGLQNIRNPLYSYRFTSLAEIPDQPFNRMPETYRWPAQAQNGAYFSQPRAVNDALFRISGNLRNRAYQLLTAYRNFNQVGSKAANVQGGRQDSLEGVHDTIHGTVGTGGHMGWVDVSSFDPIFWLHHTNIDRLFAIWQGINPTAYTLSGNSMGTFAIPRGTREDMNTGLSPFRQRSGNYHTSNTAARTKDFGYAYPETVDWTSNSGPGAVISAINTLYGRGTPSGTLAESARVAKRSLGKLKRADAVPNTVLNSPPSPDSLAPVQDQIIKNDKYEEWDTEIKVNNAALNGTFSIYIFLGAAPTDPTKFATDKNLVGVHTVFTGIGGGMDELVGGSVPLTSSLLNRVVTGDLENLKQETVVPYLKKNLKVKIAAADADSEVKAQDVKGLTVNVSKATVTLPATNEELPKYGPYESQYDAINQPKGVFLA